MGKMRPQVLEQELLETLPHDHPDALANRLDIEFLNAVMGNFRWFRQQLRELARPGDSIVELGSGDGTLIHFVAEREPDLVPQWTGLDLAPRPELLPAEVSWVQGDFFDAAGPAREALGKADVVVANLILHHFTDAQLRDQFAASLRQARVLLISEPARHWHHVQSGRLLDAILGFHPVTTHDMRVSIQAGFRTGELPRVLGLDPTEWDIWESSSFFGSCRLRAVRNSR